MITEIKNLKKHYNYFWFIDYNLFTDKKYTKQLLKELIPLRIHYFCFANTYIAKDDELLRLMAKSGCEFVSIGFETINPQNLKLIDKEKINQINEYPSIIKNIQIHGIQVKPQFIVGFDYDNANVFKHIEQFIKQNNILFPDVYIAGAFHGTKFYQRLKKEGRINTSHEGCIKCQKGYVKWGTKSMSINECLFLRFFFYKRVYS